MTRVMYLMPLAAVLTAALTVHGVSLAQTSDDLVFIHHSVGEALLNDGLRDALLAKDYIDEVNEITYGTTVTAQAGRPDYLGPVPGDLTDVHHWLLWFNDYLQNVKSYGCETGTNTIIMIKSCYPASNIYEDGTEPGDPFDSNQTLVNYRAVYRHPNGSGNTYTTGTIIYRPLEDIFAANPNTLFIIVTSPPLIPTETRVDWADRARVFWTWLKTDWLNQYNSAHPTLRNVAVFDFFDILAYPNNYTGTEYYKPGDGEPPDGTTTGTHPVRNMTRLQYRTGDSHPNTQANVEATAAFATATSNFIDAAMSRWRGVSTAVRSRWFFYK